jgi:DNA polymerase-4
MDERRHWRRQILFGDVDAMYASSAVAANPALAGTVLAVGAAPPRGIITAASYAARRFGVTAAMPTAHALRLCPDLVVVPPDHNLYRRMHQRMRDTLQGLLPVVEWSSIDEFYAETTTLQLRHPDPEALARTVKQALLEATGLRCTVAVATGKTVAKIAADRHKPDGLAVIEPGTEAAFLAAQPVAALPGIGPKTAAILARAGLRVLGDLSDPRFEPDLRRVWGHRLRAIQALVQGYDPEPVVPDRPPKSIGHETTFEEDTADLTILEETVREFLGRLTPELRREGLAAGSFRVKLKDARFKITTRQRHFTGPLNRDAPMWREIRPAVAALIRPRTRYRLVGLSLGDLVAAAPGLFDSPRADDAAAVMDALNERFGAGAVHPGDVPPPRQRH